MTRCGVCETAVPPCVVKYCKFCLTPEMQVLGSLLCLAFLVYIGFRFFKPADQAVRQHPPEAASPQEVPYAGILGTAAAVVGYGPQQQAASTRVVVPTLTPRGVSPKAKLVSDPAAGDPLHVTTSESTTADSEAMEEDEDGLTTRSDDEDDAELNVDDESDEMMSSPVDLSYQDAGKRHHPSPTTILTAMVSPALPSAATDPAAKAPPCCAADSPPSPASASAAPHHHPRLSASRSPPPSEASSAPSRGGGSALAFSVENILDPNKFTGRDSLKAGGGGASAALRVSIPAANSGVAVHVASVVTVDPDTSLVAAVSPPLGASRWSQQLVDPASPGGEDPVVAPHCQPGGDRN